MKRSLGMLTKPHRFARAMILFLLFAGIAKVQAQGVIYDEARVPEYTLPDPLVLSDGTPVTDAQRWWDRRRPEILHLFEQHVYGKTPGRPEELSFDLTSVDREGLGGKADRGGDQIVSIRELSAYVEDKLPELSESAAGRAQVPVINSRGNDFPISVVDQAG